MYMKLYFVFNDVYFQQAKDWPQHRLECRGLAGMDALTKANSTRMRLLVKAMVQPWPTDCVCTLNCHVTVHTVH